MRLYLARHGQSDGNATYYDTDKSDRNPDPELTEIGHRQARLLAEYLADPMGEPIYPPWLPKEEGQLGFGLTHVYCSLMARSISTAQYIAKACGLPLIADADIFEKSGLYEIAADGTKTGISGPDRNYFSERFPDLVLPASLNNSGWYNRPYETEEIFVQRSKQVVLDFLDRHAGTEDCVAMVIHGDLIDQLVNELTGAGRHSDNYDDHWVANWAFHNTSITRIDFVSDSRAIVYTNQFQHLPPELLTW